MALSLAVLIIPIVLLLVFYRVVLRGDAPTDVDPAPTIQEAQQAQLFTVAVPKPSGKWHVQAATFQRAAAGATLRIGYVDPDKNPLQLVESSVKPETLLPQELGSAAKPVGTFRAAGGIWRQYDARPGEQALVLSDTSRTIVIVGRAGIKNMQTLASSLT
jgi:hypothetical protein